MQLSFLQAMGDEPRRADGDVYCGHPHVDYLRYDSAEMPTSPTYSEAQDGKRIRKQRSDVFAVMASGDWRTLRQIEMLTGAPQASISARLRDFRQERFGGYTVERRRVEGHQGLWEYRVKL